MLARRASDPAKRSKVPFNAVLPVMGWSHHAKDVGTVLPSVPVTTVAALVPTTRAHVLTFKVVLDSRPTAEEIFRALDSFPRILVGSGLNSTIDIVEHFQDAGIRRNDFPGIYVWREGIEVLDGELHASIAVHMESITIPETVDCIRAALGIEREAWASIRKTDVAMGIARKECCYER
jgi:glyceraldehyde-3-phosphate dehydrogenase (NAD(P))